MNAHEHSPQDDKPKSAEPKDAGWLKQFEQKIMAYSKAASAGQHDAAQAAALEALAMAAEEAERNPTPDLLLGMEADQCEEAGDWDGAEAARRKVLALHESGLAQFDAAAKACAADSTAVQPDDDRWRFFGLIAKANVDLSGLQKRRGKLDEAWSSALAATAAARRANCWPLLHLALQNQATLALEREDSASALAAASEDVQQIEPGALSNSMRLRALVMRARCLTVTGDLTAAEQDLAASWPLIKPISHNPFAAGAHSAIAGWWEATAKLRTRKQDVSGAVTAWKQAVEKRREVARLPHVNRSSALTALATALQGCGEAFRQAGDADAARAALAEPETIRRDLGL